MTPIETLQGMRDLLTEPVHWTTGSRARNARGEYVAPSHQNAVCWCIVGAYQKVSRELSDKDVYALFSNGLAGTYLQDAVNLQGRFANPWLFNDCTTHSQVIALIDSALVLAKKAANV